MGRPKKAYDYIDALKKISAAGLTHPVAAVSEDAAAEELASLSERVRQILGLAQRVTKEKNRMLFFVMYDIEDNRVRRYVVKYLEAKGCLRIQKSIFLANTTVEVYESIKHDLTEVLDVYDNHDSILVVPITSDYLRSMKIIGQNINVDVITQSQNTLFF